MSREVWEAVETKARKVRVAEAEGGGKEGRRRKEVRRKEAKWQEEEKTEERKNARGKKDSRRIGDLG